MHIYYSTEVYIQLELRRTGSQMLHRSVTIRAKNADSNIYVKWTVHGTVNCEKVQGVLMSEMSE